MSKRIADQTARSSHFTYHPLTPDHWHNLEQLFGPRGACGGCWDMWWRLKRSEFEAQKGEGNRKAFKSLVDAGTMPGILAYDGEEPVGWCAIQPREAYPALERSRILKRVDDQPVWSITCFFIARPYRRTGISTELIKAAIAHAREHGATIVEGYPKEQKQDKEADVFAWTGYVSAFAKAGFVEVARRSETRPVMRKVL